MVIIMPHPTGPTDTNMVEVAKRLRKPYPQIAKHLMRPRRSKKPVNVGTLGKASEKSSTLAVGGIVLASGEITKPVSVYAWKFSAKAKEKITKAGGKAMPLAELAESKEKARVVI